VQTYDAKLSFCTDLSGIHY